MKKQTLSDKIGMKGQQLAIEAEDIKEFIKQMDEWCESIGRTTLITAETAINVLKNKAGDKLI